MKRTSRKPSKLSELLQRHLNAYALAASAAGVGALAAVPPVEAEIIYTKTHHVIGPHETYPLSLNHKGADIAILELGFGLGFTYLLLVGLGSNAVRGYTFLSESYASRLNKGSVISSKLTFVANERWALMAGYVCSSECGYEGGPWAFNRNGYLGVKFRIGKQIHYGWARLTVHETGHYTFKATVLGYAYETVPNKPIIAGKTKGPEVIAVQPGSLGQLAQGSAGR